MLKETQDALFTTDVSPRLVAPPAWRAWWLLDMHHVPIMTAHRYYHQQYIQAHTINLITLVTKMLLEGNVKEDNEKSI